MSPSGRSSTQLPRNRENASLQLVIIMTDALSQMSPLVTFGHSQTRPVIMEVFP
jgi:hypothetical protein